MSDEQYKDLRNWHFVMFTDQHGVTRLSSVTDTTYVFVDENGVKIVGEETQAPDTVFVRVGD
jgi:hypothetical protein